VALKDMFGRAKSSIGLDVGSSAVKAVEVTSSRSSRQVTWVGSEPVPPDAIVDGAILDGASVADAISRLFEAGRVKTKDVIASLSGSAVIVKKITLPLMTDSELGESIHWEAEQYIPFDIQDVTLDYQVVEGDSEGAARGTMDVLLVAAKKEKIADYSGVIAQAGRNPVVVDVDAFALQNAYEVNYGIEPGLVVVLMNAGASAINVNILNGEQSVFTRDISIGGNDYTEALQKELSLPFENADMLKCGVPIEGLTFDEAIPALAAVTDNVMLEVQKTFDFFKATAASDQIDQIVLSGGTAQIDGLADTMADRFGTQVEMFDPFRQLQLDNKKTGDVADLASTAAVAVGLALRQAGDR
jgi:type IV pilus assembly protein PilM|tara:strand:+ start:5003 stop:6073 length:1071 start_codon:yes stop_codon:yes gene_type:complete